MSNLTHTRLVRAVVALGAAVMLVAPGRLSAQVGHPPGRSPYRDIHARQTLSLTGGYLTGGAGKAGVGPTTGPMGGIELDFRLGRGVVNLGLGFLVADLERLVLDPNRLPGDRVKGTERQRIAVADAGVAMVLTGGKTWHGFAPYFGATMGIAFGGNVPSDSSGFDFGTHFHAGPKLGFRWYLSQRLVFRTEGRDILWRLSYPTLFFTPPPDDPDAAPILDPLTTKRTEWTHHPTLTFSLGYAIRM